MKEFNDPVIWARGITKSFGGIYALRGVDVAVKRGEFLSIFGPNGAGKSTLIRILSTLSKASSGEITIAGVKVKESPEKIRRLIGVVTHQTFLYGDLTAEENLRFYAKMYDISNPRQRIDQILARFGLDRRRNEPVRTFSRGMQQRLAIARALLHDPLILFLDEPYTGLDQQAAELLRQTMVNLISKNCTIVMTTHDLERGLQIANRFIVLVAGRIVYQGDKDSILPEELIEKYTGLVKEAASELY